MILNWTKPLMKWAMNTPDRSPQACSMLSAENPETEGQVYSVAPAEGQRPINIMTDTNFEVMCNPDKFPFGTGGFNDKRPKKIT